MKVNSDKSHLLMSGNNVVPNIDNNQVWRFTWSTRDDYWIKADIVSNPNQ